jgi:murein DD-endopeptidase MepM/ murein hydrolase activator NlpD
VYSGQVEDLSRGKSGYNQNSGVVHSGAGTGTDLGEYRLGQRMHTIAKGIGLAVCLLLGGFSAGFAQDYSFAPVSGQVTSPFGWRTDPISGGPRFHGGIDIAAASGTPVYAPQAGYVAFSGYYGGYGNVVVLNHGNSLYTVYGHNSQLLVKAGDAVYRGQVISLVGSTGRSTGPHLHFEVHYNQQYLNPVTYLSYLQQSVPMLAQVPRSTGVISVNGRASASKAGSSVKTVQRTASRVKHAGGGQVVQLVNGSDVEMIEF